MILIAEIIFIGANLSMAGWHSFLIKEGRSIKHGYWAAVYLLFAGLVSYFNNSLLLFICALLIRKVVFDLLLNLFLKRQLFYVSTETTSIIDKLHYKLFGKKSEIYMSIYFAAIIIINLFI